MCKRDGVAQRLATGALMVPDVSDLFASDCSSSPFWKRSIRLYDLGCSFHASGVVSPRRSSVTRSTRGCILEAIKWKTAYRTARFVVRTFAFVYARRAN